MDAGLNLVAPGVNLFPFDPSFGPGYVWHYHLLDHEDNEMMRPLRVISPAVRGIEFFRDFEDIPPLLDLSIDEI